MLNMKDIAVYYDKISAFDMLVDLARLVGIESIQAALDDITAQHSAHPTLESGRELPAEVVKSENALPAGSG